MKLASRTLLWSSLAVSVIMCVGFSFPFLRGGFRSGFLLSLLVLVAISGLTLASSTHHSRFTILVGLALGLVGPAIGTILVTGFEAGMLEPGTGFYQGLTQLMAFFWLPGNWVSAMLGMETRLADLDLSRLAEFLEWIRLVPLNAATYTAGALILQYAYKTISNKG